MREKESKTRISRRGFIKAAMAGTGAVALGGMNIRETDAMVPPRKWDKETDVVVAGGGAAGLSAAVKVHDKGAKVLLIEAAPTFYSSSSAICNGSFASANSKAHRKMGIDYPPEKFYEDLMKWGMHTNIPELAKAYAETSGEVIDWLVDLGLKIMAIEPPRVFSEPANGRTVIEVVVKDLKKKKIPTLYKTRLTELIVDPTKGRVLGVRVEKDGKSINIKARKATILAAGGFAGNYELYDRILLDMRGGYSMCSPYARGEGMLAGQKIGADVTHLAYCAPYACGLPVNPGRLQPLTTTPLHMYKVGGIYINKEGKRFCDEAQPLSFVGLEYLPKQPDKFHYYIFDNVLWEKWKEDKKRPPHRVLLEDVKNKDERLIKTADTLENLAGKIEVDPQALKETVTKFNSYVESGKDMEFKRKKAMEHKIAAPPFYAMGQMRNMVALTLGGLRTNGKTQVLDPYGKIIPGLYAAGEIMGGVHGNQYHGGTAFGKAFTFGYIAGIQAAAEKPWDKGKA